MTHLVGWWFKVVIKRQRRGEREGELDADFCRFLSQDPTSETGQCGAPIGIVAAPQSVSSKATRQTHEVAFPIESCLEGHLQHLRPEKHPPDCPLPFRAGNPWNSASATENHEACSIGPLTRKDGERVAGRTGGEAPEALEETGYTG
jgi:hypothetical protein